MKDLTSRTRKREQRVSGRDPATKYEVAAQWHFHGRYGAQGGGVIEFYASLNAGERDFIQRMVKAIEDAPETVG